jgi:electron transport complex protein RnfB
MFAVLITIVCLALIFGLLLGYAAIRFKVASDPLVDQVNEILPQTQCGQCGYPGCRPYAEAIANGDDINKCPPGGEGTIKKLADLMGVDVKPLDSAHGEEEAPKVAIIREAECIGCTKCIQACPVDAIIGATRQMHTVIEKECTGCDLCVAPCPVDCIDMVPVKQTPENWKWQLNNIPIKNVNE